MQINGIGSNSTSGTYQNTNRKPTYEIPEEKKEDSVSAKEAEYIPSAQYLQLTRSASADKQPGTENTENTVNQEEAYTLGEWLKIILEKAKVLLSKIWNGEEPADAAAVAETVPPPQDLTDDTVSATIEVAADQRENVWQKIKVRFENVAGFLMKQFSFSDKDAFQNQTEKGKDEQAQENASPDYTGEHAEMGRMLRDEKYFTTTYNKKGQYTTFAAPPSKDKHVIDEDL